MSELVVKISGAKGSGRTHLQMALAEVLQAYGHQVNLRENGKELKYARNAPGVLQRAINIEVNDEDVVQVNPEHLLFPELWAKPKVKLTKDEVGLLGNIWMESFRGVSLMVKPLAVFAAARASLIKGQQVCIVLPVKGWQGKKWEKVLDKLLVGAEKVVPPPKVEKFSVTYKLANGSVVRLLSRKAVVDDHAAAGMRFNCIVEIAPKSTNHLTARMTAPSPHRDHAVFRNKHITAF
ncbi:MAG TPA: hypothetical protein VGH19_06750 [Verrucomicrobiae bacterium]